MNTIRYPINVEAERLSVIQATQNYTRFREKDGRETDRIFYRPSQQLGFAVVTTLVDCSSLTRGRDGLFRPNQDTEALVFERLPRNSGASQKGFVTGFLDTLTTAPRDIFTTSMGKELEEECGIAEGQLALMQPQLGGAHSYVEPGGRTMHIYPGFWALQGKRPQVTTDRYEPGESHRELGESYWVPLGELAMDAVQNPEDYTPSFAETTLEAMFIPIGGLSAILSR